MSRSDWRKVKLSDSIDQDYQLKLREKVKKLVCMENPLFTSHNGGVECIVDVAQQNDGTFTVYIYWTRGRGDDMELYHVFHNVEEVMTGMAAGFSILLKLPQTGNLFNYAFVTSFNPVRQFQTDQKVVNFLEGIGNNSVTDPVAITKDRLYFEDRRTTDAGPISYVLKKELDDWINAELPKKPWWKPWCLHTKVDRRKDVHWSKVYKREVPWYNTSTVVNYDANDEIKVYSTVDPALGIKVRKQVRRDPCFTFRGRPVQPGVRTRSIIKNDERAEKQAEKQAEAEKQAIAAIITGATSTQ